MKLQTIKERSRNCEKKRIFVSSGKKKITKSSQNSKRMRWLLKIRFVCWVIRIANSLGETPR